MRDQRGRLRAPNGNSRGVHFGKRSSVQRAEEGKRAREKGEQGDERPRATGERKACKTRIRVDLTRVRTLYWQAWPCGGCARGRGAIRGIADWFVASVDLGSRPTDRRRVPPSEHIREPHGGWNEPPGRR